MKILHVCSYFSTSPLFGQLFDRQVANGQDIDVYVPISKQYPEERISSDKSYAQTVRVFNQIDRYFYFYKQNKIYRDLNDRYQTNEYDLIHAHSLFTNGFMAYKINQTYGTPYIVAVRSNEIETFFKRAFWLRSMGLRILKNASKIIFISQNTYDDTFKNYIPEDIKASLLEKTHVITNGIDQFWHDNAYTERQTELVQPLKIVATAKLQKVKNLETLADYVAKYNQEVAPAELHVIGPNWDQKIHDNLIAKAEVTYHGPMNKDELVAFYRQADIFALISSPETFGLVYVEAMSQSLPVIYTKGEGFDSFFPNHQIGVSVDRTSADDFIEAVKFITNHYEQLSSEAVEKSKQFQWDDINQTYLDMYQDITHS